MSAAPATLALAARLLPELARDPRPTRRPPCRHCGLRSACRPRGLCPRCYETPGVRALYATPPCKFNRRGSGTEPQGQRPLPAPTDALPGTAAKIAVLTERARQGQRLFHPADATLAGRQVAARRRAA
ncbi:MAG: hypothetical protein JNM56_29005 [Planctomycetia bacterium]|nr:hypothetical protein [Planctomycetia bacterium]